MYANISIYFNEWLFSWFVNYFLIYFNMCMTQMLDNVEKNIISLLSSWVKNIQLLNYYVYL